MATPSLTLRRLALLVAAAYATPLLAAPAARIEFSTGEPVIVGADGRERPAAKGEQIVAGDRILTRAGRAQLAFADGAFVSLQPNTDFGVTEYNFAGRNDGTEKSVLSLLKGALRTVTGLIGRNKRDAYLMTTPTATIGIRGTGGRIEVNDQGTLVAGTSGTWFISTLGGSIDIPAGTTGFAGTDRQSPPNTISGGPSTPPASPRGSQSPSNNLVAGDQITAQGSSAAIPPSPTTSSTSTSSTSTAPTTTTTTTSTTTTLTPPPAMANGSGYRVVYAYNGGPTSPAGTTATFSSGIQLATFQDSTMTQSVGTAIVRESGNDGIIGWGRWTEGTIVLNGANTTLNANEGLHYVVGIPTASLPTSGTATYSVIGFTKPTDTTGVLAPGTLSSMTMSVDFNTATVGMGIAIDMNGPVYSVSGSFPASPTFFSTGLSGSSGACAGSGCMGTVAGAFYGTSAERAGVTYKISDPSNNNYIGSAALTKN